MKFTTGKYKGQVIAECNDYSYLCRVKQHGGWKNFTREQLEDVNQRITVLIHEKWVKKGVGEMVNGEFAFSPVKEEKIYSKEEVIELGNKLFEAYEVYDGLDDDARKTALQKWIKENL